MKMLIHWVSMAEWTQLCWSEACIERCLKHMDPGLVQDQALQKAAQGTVLQWVLLQCHTAHQSER